jgi:3(or 17)beta-hydroxysteroid dehydrogenase
VTESNNKVAIVTGAGSGIGEATAEVLAQTGTSVVVTDIDAAAAEQTAQIIQQRGQRALSMEQDVRSREQWDDVFAAAQEHFGPVTGLVNNAGISGAGRDRLEEEGGLEAWQSIMSINLDAVHLGCRKAIQEMKLTGGSIVNISSVMGLVGGAGPAYNASKGGVRLLSKSIAVHCGKMGYSIRCNSVHPGYIWTPMVRNIVENMEDIDTEEELHEMLLALHPVGRLGHPDDIANGVNFLLSDQASFVTGSELVIDGGYTSV